MKLVFNAVTCGLLIGLVGSAQPVIFGERNYHNFRSTDSSRTNALQLRVTRANARALAPGHVRLNLFEDAVYDTVLTRVHPPTSGLQSFHGTIAGDPRTFVVLIENEGTLFGSVTAPNGRRFVVRSDAEGLTTITEQDTALPPEAPTEISRENVASKENGALYYEDSEVVSITLLVGYTPGVVAACGSLLATQQAIQTAVAEANASYEQAGIYQRLELVGLIEVKDTDERQNLPILFDQLSRKDPAMDELLRARYLLKADIVSLWVSQVSPSYCGVGYLLQGTPREASGLNVVEQRCATTIFTMTHEIGHNMGAHHDQDNALAQSGFYPYSFGYRKAGKDGFRTIMAYPCYDIGGDCPRINLWSDPERAYNGAILGVTGQTNNRATLNGTRRLVADFWKLATLPPPRYWRLTE